MSLKRILSSLIFKKAVPMPDIKTTPTPIFVVNSAEKPTAFPTASSITPTLQKMMSFSLLCIQRGDKINLDFSNCVWSSKVLTHIAYFLVANAWSSNMVRISNWVQVVADQNSVVDEFMGYLAREESILPPIPKVANLLFDLRDAAENSRPGYLDVRKYVELYYQNNRHADREACYAHLTSTFMCVMVENGELRIQFGSKDDQQPVSDFMNRLAETIVTNYDILLGEKSPDIVAECAADSSIVEEFHQCIQKEIERNMVFRPMAVQYLRDSLDNDLRRNWAR